MNRTSDLGWRRAIRSAATILADQAVGQRRLLFFSHPTRVHVKVEFGTRRRVFFRRALGCLCLHCRSNGEFAGEAFSGMRALSRLANTEDMCCRS